jgi:hypothetical protein
MGLYATAALLGLICAGFLYLSGAFHRPAFWILPILLVHGFSVSGGMHNIIEDNPFQLMDKKGVIHSFAPPGEGQLGAEGFLMGAASLGFGFLLLVVAYIGPRIKSSAVQRVLIYLSVALLIFLYRQINSIHTWKVGFSYERFINLPHITGL